MIILYMMKQRFEANIPDFAREKVKGEKKSAVVTAKRSKTAETHPPGRV